MVMVNDKVGSIKVIEAVASGDANSDLNYLLEQSTNGLMVFWDLDASIKPIIDELPKYAREAIQKHGKCVWRDWDIFYIRSKVFSVSYRGGHNYLFYNLSQYFPEVENPGVDIAERCADEIEHALHIMGIWPLKLSSPAAIFQDYYGKHLELPTFKDFMPEYEKLLEFAARCAGNEWNEVVRICYLKECWAYDRTSAYGSEMIKLLDNRPKYMTILESDKYIPEATYAYCDCDIEIKDNILIHPIFHINYDGGISSRVGEWRGYLTKGQMDFMRHWKIGDYEINRGWWLIPRTKVKPLEFVIPRILQFKEHENSLVRDLAKTMINGFAGKFNEEYKDRVGDLYNPMWSAEIITGNALNLASTIYHSKAYNNIIQIKIDEFKTTQKLETLPEGYKESSGECLAIDNRTVFYHNQHPDDMTLVQALSMLNAHPNISYYEQGEAVIDLWRLELSRVFGKTPETGGQLLNNVYESKPLTIGEE